jgi:hypothetical protein
MIDVMHDYHKLEFILITNDITKAMIADNCGVDYIMIDLEIEGKSERQKGTNSLISTHTFDDILNVSKIIKKSKIIVRINPLSNKSKEEINMVISCGADFIMVPMIKNANEVMRLHEIVDDRVPTILLLENKDAMNNIESIILNSKASLIHFGLNDLAISLKLEFMFETLTNGYLEYILQKAIKISPKLNFGIGGIGSIGKGVIDSALLIKEHRRLGSKRVILSRSFLSSIDINDSNYSNEFCAQISKMTEIYNRTYSEEHYKLNKNQIKLLVDDYVKNK